MITKIKYAIVKGLLLNIECFSLIIWQWFEIMSRFTVIIAFDSSVGRAMDCRSFTSISMGPVFESQSKDVLFLDFFVSSFGQSLYAIFSVFRVFVVWTNFLFPYEATTSEATTIFCCRTVFNILTTSNSQFSTLVRCLTQNVISIELITCIKIPGWEWMWRNSDSDCSE